jgi:hypothetical protein
VLALRTTESAISNVYFMVRTGLTEDKALVLRLSSFWGILTVFAFMEITEEAFTRLNTAQWRVLLALNVRELDEDVKCLAFDKNANFGRLTNNLGGEEVIITKLSISPKPTRKRSLVRFTQKTQFQPNQAIHTPPFTPCPPNLEKIFIKGDTEIVCDGVEDG